MWFGPFGIGISTETINGFKFHTLELMFMRKAKQFKNSDFAEGTDDYW